MATYRSIVDSLTKLELDIGDVVISKVGHKSVVISGISSRDYHREYYGMYSGDTLCKEFTLDTNQEWILVRRRELTHKEAMLKSLHMCNSLDHLKAWIEKEVVK